MGRGADPGKRDALPREQGKLQADELVVGKPAPGRLLCGHARRKVHVAQGARVAHKASARHQVRRQKVTDVADVGQGGRDDPAHPRGSHALAHGMHGQDARVAATLLGA